MIGSTYLAPRLEPHVLEDRDGLREYLRTEFGSADARVVEGPWAPRRSNVPLNGGRNGWLAKARGAVAMAGVFLLSPFSHRSLAGRNAPQSPPRP